MNRTDFLKTLAIIPMAGIAMNLTKFKTITDSFANSELMPVLFVGHGNPMNAIETNEFSLEWQRLGKILPKPSAILCVSAHWETQGTFVTAMNKPATIHDFGGFPKELFDVQYPAPGDPVLAKETQSLYGPDTIGLDYSWGLDHGTWSILKIMYPEAEIPVIQLSLDHRKDAQYHYNLAGQLAKLREKGVLIIGSGNMVHNLRKVDWSMPGKGFDWAEEANTRFKQLIIDNNHSQLVNYRGLGSEVELSVPTPEHFLPLLYTLSVKKNTDTITFFNDKSLMGSLSMTSVILAS